MNSRKNLIPKTGSESQKNIDSKMCNIAKLRQQFVEEMKIVETTLKETISKLQNKLAEVTSQVNYYNEKLKEFNKIICEESVIIFTKEQEIKMFTEKVQELYNHQKILCEHMDEVNKILCSSEESSFQLKAIYESVLKNQDTEIRSLELKQKNITPDKKLLTELTNLKSNEQQLEQEKLAIEKDLSYLNSELKAKKRRVDEQFKTETNELVQKLNSLEEDIQVIKQKAEEEEIKYNKDLENSINENTFYKEEMTKMMEDNNKMKATLEAKRTQKSAKEEMIRNLNNQIEALVKEDNQLDEVRCKDVEENQKMIEKLNDKLKNKKGEIASLKEKEMQAITVLQKKVNDMREKIKNNNSLNGQLETLEKENKKIQDDNLLVEKDFETKQKQVNDKIKKSEDTIKKLKEEIKKNENKSMDFEEKIKKLTNDIHEKSRIQKETLKIMEEKKTDYPNTQKPSISNFPKALDLSDIEVIDKLQNKKKAYTPTLEDEDDEFDALSFEEQFSQLTQATSSSLSLTPEKNKKFFKNTTPGKSRKESSSRTKSRTRKYQ